MDGWMDGSMDRWIHGSISIDAGDGDQRGLLSLDIERHVSKLVILVPKCTTNIDVDVDVNVKIDVYINIDVDIHSDRPLS